MQENELLSFCSEKNILLDSSLVPVFSNLPEEPAKILINKIKTILGKNFINKSLINQNKLVFRKFIEEISVSENFDFSEMKLEFNLDKKEAEKEKKVVFEKEIEPKVKVVSGAGSSGKKLEVKNFTTYFRNRYNDLKNIIQGESEFENLVSINKISGNKEKFDVIGMVISKKFSKNKNYLLEIEDFSGKMKVVISGEKEDLAKEAEDISLDSVLGFKGVGNREIMFVNEIIFPEPKIKERKKSFVEEHALFVGDLHYGSKNFLKDDFLKFIDYLSGDGEEVSKIKYLFVVGDLVTGVGNYPNQEKDLKIKDLEEQFQELAKLFGKIRKDIQIIILPGNHDGVRLIEPQPTLDEKYAWPLFELENVVMVGNPCTVNIAEKKDFSGFDVLCYHGFSFPFYANNVPKLMIEKVMNEPEKIMKYLLKNRHLAPTQGSVQYFPLEKDAHLIRKVPDIFVAGHTHKSGVCYHNNVLLVSVSSWEGMTPYQEKFGNEPDHCKVPMLNLKTRAVKILDFESKEGEDEDRN